MKKFWLFVAVVLLAPSAAASEAGDALSAAEERAAYCAGVLSHGLRWALEHGAPSASELCQQQRGYASNDACITNVRQAVVADLQRRLSRYNDYLSIRMESRLLRSDDNFAELPAIALIRKKGADDAHAVALGPVPLDYFKQCVHRCGLELRCVDDCIAEAYPTHASVMRCVGRPDELPF